MKHLHFSQWRDRLGGYAASVSYWCAMVVQYYLIAVGCVSLGGALAVLIGRFGLGSPEQAMEFARRHPWAAAGVAAGGTALAGGGYYAAHRIANSDGVAAGRKMSRISRVA